MPIYEYECQECGRVFEKIQRFSDDPLTEYPCECQSGTKAVPVKKLVSAAAFHLKGSGWYVTDFRDGSGKKKQNGKDDTAKGDAKPESSSESKGESTSKDKPEPKTDAKSEPKPASGAATGAT